MQSNTTGHSMETFFDILFVCLMTYSLILVIAVSKRIRNLEIENDFFKSKFIPTIDLVGEDIDRLEMHVGKISEQINALPDVIRDDNHRSLLALRETLEPAKPIKPNNWDSMKEAFKGPTKVTINERD
jgi:hypothetical protein